MDPRTNEVLHRVTAELAGMIVEISTLKLDPSNVRRHPARQLEAIKASLTRFGQQKPIVIDARGVVIAGNGTLEAALLLGWTHIAAVQSTLDGVERISYAIADNRTAELAEWDLPALGQLLGSLDADSLGAAGYTAHELEQLLEESHPTRLEEHGAEPVAPPAVCQHGELWILGQHRLLCGNSRQQADVDRLMGTDRAALVATDPPYLVEYTGLRAGGVGKDWSQQYREVEIDDAHAFYREVFGAAAKVMAPHAAVYCWHAHKRIGELLAAWRHAGILDHQQIIWVKPSPVFGSVFWHFRHEPCIMGWLKGSKPRHDGRHHPGSVWTDCGVRVPLDQLSKPELVEMLKQASSVWDIDWEGKSRPGNNEHPTQKPIEIFARPMRKHTMPGDVVFEPFSGSGSQLIAAEQLGRKCRAIEIEPTFVDVAIRRWQSLTGRDAIHEASGETWAKRAARMGHPCDAPSAPASTSAAPS
jgi:DNA modification methylase